jgi:quercetin dioxygenase-like cupin family protein
VNEESAGQGEQGTASVGIILGPGEGRTVPGADTLSLKATSEQTGGSIGVLEATSPPGYGPPRHIHHSSDELFYVLEGEFLFLVGEREVSAMAGSFVFIPRGDGSRRQGHRDQAWQGAYGLRTWRLGAILRRVRSGAHRAGRR